MDDLWFVLRWINICLYGGVVTALVMYSRFLFPAPSKTPWARWWIIGLIFVGMYGTAEVVWLDQPGGLRVILVTVMLTGTFVTLYVPSAQNLWRTLKTRRAEKRC